MSTTTPNFGWVVPTSTDLVKDGASAIETLGDSIDASLVDLKGGTTGQVLSKNTNTDMDFTWVTPNDADAIQNTIVDARGDLITATASDVPARIGVGSDGQVLTADSTTATGLKWGAAAGTFVGCSVYKSATQSVNNDTQTAITFDTEDYDTDGFHSTSSNTSRMTIPSGKDGYYLINMICTLDTANVNGRRVVYIFKNGASVMKAEASPYYATNDVYPTPQLSYVLYLVAGDYVEMYFYGNSGSAITVSNGTTGPHFQIVKVG